MTDTRVLALCSEYVHTVDAMRSGRYTTDEIHTLDSERILLHDELCRLLTLDRSVDMYRRAKALLLHGKGGNVQ